MWGNVFKWKSSAGFTVHACKDGSSGDVAIMLVPQSVSPALYRLYRADAPIGDLYDERDPSYFPLFDTTIPGQPSWIDSHPAAAAWAAGLPAVIGDAQEAALAVTNSRAVEIYVDGTIHSTDWDGVNGSDIGDGVMLYDEHISPALPNAVANIVLALLGHSTVLARGRTLLTKT